MKIALFGATAKTGRPLARALADAGHEVIGIGRDAGRLGEVAGLAGAREADLETPGTLGAAMSGAEAVISLAHARYIGAILVNLPPKCRRVVVTGSTRKFTRFPDAAADAVRAGEAAFESFVASHGEDVCATLLHPTMIYGAPGERNISRLRHAFRRWPRWLPLVVPLPGGGRATVQPVHFEDVVASFVAAVGAKDQCGAAVIVAGPEPVRYRDLVRAVAAAEGRRAWVLPLPAGVLAGLAAVLPLPFGADAIRRATENKAFNVAEVTSLLERAPVALEDGLVKGRP